MKSLQIDNTIIEQVKSKRPIFAMDLTFSLKN